MGNLAEPVLVTTMCGGDASSGMRLLANSSLAAGLMQFALNPTFGTLSDRFGRRKFFLVGPAISALSMLLLAAFPRMPVFFCVKGGCTTAALSFEDTRFDS